MILVCDKLRFLRDDTQYFLVNFRELSMSFIVKIIWGLNFKMRITLGKKTRHKFYNFKDAYVENSITLDSLVCISMSNAPRKNNYLTSFISIQECLEYKEEEKEIANFIIVWVTKFRNDFSWLANYGRVQARDKLLNWITILRNNYNICKSHVIVKFIQSQRQFFFNFLR